jgi:hypothetical protein
MKKMRRLLFCASIVSILAICASAQEHKFEKKSSWIISERDLKVELPETSEKEDNHKIEISRRFKGAFEEELLKKAEAAYPSNDEKSIDASGLSERSIDNIRVAKIITASAVRYYYDLSKELRRNVNYIKGYPFERTTLKYEAEIKFQPEYTHGKEKFSNVYVAKMSLFWEAYCGLLCGGGFSRKKEVVFDANGDIVALFLDAPENMHIWES